MNPNIGHGHVYPRPDGVKARCGGPALCGECARDFVRKSQEVRTDAEAIAAVPELAGKKALVLYFETDADRDDFARLVVGSMRNVRTEKL